MTEYLTSVRINVDFGNSINDERTSIEKLNISNIHGGQPNTGKGGLD
jgi:hypothetical protein